MNDTRLETLRVQIDAGLATVTLDWPPINLFGPPMHRDLEQVLDLVDEDPTARVVVLQSANPDFFCAHYDVGEILREPDEVRTTAGGFNRLMARFDAGSAITIAKIRGAARGGGCELALGCDIRFASAERAMFSFPEVALGILAAGGGTQRLPIAAGRARALEMLLGCDDVSAEVAERYGLVNRALPDSELDRFVERLARRIAERPVGAVTATRLSVRAAMGEPGETGQALEAVLLDLLKSGDEARCRMQRFLGAGGQTAAGEADFAALLRAAESNES